jgi:hypothetical protein
MRNIRLSTDVFVEIWRTLYVAGFWVSVEDPPTALRPPPIPARFGLYMLTLSDGWTTS